MFQGCKFESQHHKIYVHFFTYLLVVKFVKCVLKRQKNEKEAEVGPFFKQNTTFSSPSGAND